MNFRLLLILIIISTSAYSQEDTSTVIADDSLALKKKWELNSLLGLTGTQTSFVNWSAGGRNNIAVMASINATAVYTCKKITWTNDLSTALGGVQYLGKSADKALQKTDDRIDLSTNLGYKIKEHLNFSFLGGLKTQMLDGFSYPNDSVRVSTFLAPGYVNLALGLDYIKSDDFSIFTSPVAAKLTIVNDQVLSNAGAFGVKGATYDTSGNVLVPGERFRGEFGAYIKVKYNKALAKNIDMTSKLELFSNYVENPQNIDVNAEVYFNFKINSWLSTNLQFTLIYDDDVDIVDADGNSGPRTQFKSVLGLGINYKIPHPKKEENPN